MDRREFLLAALAMALSRAEPARDREAAPRLALATADTEAQVVA